MNSLWARIKPLLARVTKPARDIGCEIGVATHRQVLVTVCRLVALPEKHEFGVSNQGLQVHHELKTERDIAVAERVHAHLITSHDPTRRHVGGSFPLAPRRDARSSGVRMRRDCTNGEQRARSGARRRERR